MTGKAEHLRVVGNNPASPVDPLVGATLDGRYRIESRLGEGGMGVVYRARHTSLNKALAVKVLRAEVSKNEEIVSRFRQEALSATDIGNEHIVDISDFGTLEDGSTYFVMEFLDGQSLAQALEADAPFIPERAISIAKQLCHALGAAHERGIVHRDLKPDNILLIQRSGSKDFVKVLDFGIAKVGGATSKLTKAGQIFGTPHYMSPEQCAGKAVDQRTDIYALGVILYEMTSGHVPFDADNMMGILTKHMYEHPIPPRELNPPVDVPPSLEAIMLKCLAKAPEGRYATMTDLLADLERAYEGRTPAAVLESLSSRTSSGGDGGPRRPMPSSASADDHPSPAKRSNKTWIAIGGAVIVVGAVAIALAVGGKSKTAKPPAVVETKAPEQAKSDEVPAGATPDAAQVSITSEPEGVEVYRDGELVGNTPFEVARPGEGHFVELKLRRAGYKEQSIRISARTAKSVEVALVPESSAPTPGEPKKTRRPRPSGGGEHGPTKTSSEVVDPWG